MFKIVFCAQLLVCSSLAVSDIITRGKLDGLKAIAGNLGSPVVHGRSLSIDPQWTLREGLFGVIENCLSDSK